MKYNHTSLQTVDKVHDKCRGFCLQSEGISLCDIPYHGLRPIKSKTSAPTHLCSHPFLCEHKWVGALVFDFARLKPNVHIYTVSLPSGGLLLPGIVRLGVHCLF